MLLFTVFDNGTANTPAADLTSFREIMSKSVAFLALDIFLELGSLRSFLTSSVWYMVTKVYACVENFSKFT